MLQRRFLEFQLSEVNLPRTEGRRPECKYKVNNNSCSTSKRSALVSIKETKSWKTILMFLPRRCPDHIVNIKSLNIGNDLEGGYRCALRYLIFYATHCVAIVAHRWFLGNRLGIWSKFPKQLGHEIFSRDPYGKFS